MKAHPKIYLYPRPDLNYFVEDELNTRKWFSGEVSAEAWDRRHNIQEYAKLFEEGQGYQAVGHKGADLLFWRPAHARMARFLPHDTKFIVILRNPVKRAWSHYWNEVGKGRETLSFEEALAAEEERMKRSAYSRFHLSYMTRGFYERSLESFFETFPPSRVLIITLEECQAHPKETLQKIYSFLGLNPHIGLELAGKRFNENWTTIPRKWAQSSLVSSIAQVYTRLVEAVVVRLFKGSEGRRKARRYLQFPFRKSASGIPMPKELYVRLSEAYAPHIEALEKLLNTEFPQWRV